MKRGKQGRGAEDPSSAPAPSRWWSAGAAGLLVLALGLQATGEVRSANVNQMTRNINRALMEVLKNIDNINYTEYKPYQNYTSSTTFNSKGMGVVYNITDRFMDVIMPDLIPEDLIIINDRGVGVKNDDYISLVKHYIIYISFILSLLVFAVLMPVCGFCFCCCRCCCRKCGARTKAIDKKGDFCMKFIYGSLLICFGTLFLFGVVCAFVTNQHMQDGTEEFASNMKTSVADTNRYFDDISNHSRVLLKVNFKEFSSSIMDTLDQSAVTIFDNLIEVTNAVSIEQAVKVAENMGRMKTNLTELKNLTNTIRVEASQLNDATRQIKRDLRSALQSCDKIPDCSNLINEYVDKLGTDIDFDQIPDVSLHIGKLENIDKLEAQVKNGEHKLKDIEKKIEGEVTSKIERVKESIKEAGVSLDRQSDKVFTALNEVNANLTSVSQQHLRTADKYIKEYSKYRYWVGLGAACVLLLIIICITLGLVCGICGKRPDSYNDDCCNKGAGGRFLICAVGFMFLSAIALVAVLLVHSVGMFVHLGVCDPIREPNHETLRFFDKIIDLEKYLGTDITIESVLKDCYANKSVYNVFHLKNKFDLDKVKNFLQESNVGAQIDDLIEKIEFTDTNVELLTEDAEKFIDELIGSRISELPLDKYIDELSNNFTTVSLQEFSTHLKELIANLEPKPSFRELVPDLKLISIQLDAYIEKIFNPMMKHAQLIRDKILGINETLYFGGERFENSLRKLKKNITDAEEVLSAKGSDELVQIAKEFAERIKQEVNKYTKTIAFKFEKDVGNCGPLALAINGTVTSTCDKILAPMNGFWFSIFWCLVLFLPTIIVSVRLSSLYQKSDQIPGGYYEAEYLYDAYADRENIPLARGKYNKKNKKKRSDRYPEAGYSAGHREYAGASHHPDARYADMAPKHYEDYPNGGPPQYQRATEYERPPPYYYPGSGDQN